MKKNITKEQVIETALELMKNSNNLGGLNFREVARTLGCAHTNLYNYFSSYNDLLWEAHATMQEHFMMILTEQLENASTAEHRLICFFETFVNVYMDKKGWFRLAWHEYIDGERPQRDIDATEAANKMLNNYIADVWNELYGEYPARDLIKRVMHNTHCYIIGEISNHILGRGLIENETEFRTYITREAINIFKLCILNPS